MVASARTLAMAKLTTTPGKRARLTQPNTMDSRYFQRQESRKNQSKHSRFYETK